MLAKQGRERKEQKQASVRNPITFINIYIYIFYKYYHIDIVIIIWLDCKTVIHKIII